MSIASELTDLANNKAAIKSAIEAKNPTISPTNALSQWPTAIASIPRQKEEQSKTVSPTTSGTTVNPDSGKVLSSVTVNPVTSSIDSNIQAGNIKTGVTILGVNGNVIPAKTEQSKTVTPTAAGFTVTPDSGKVLSSVVVNGDADLVAGNIKKDIEIFGVTGSYEGSGGGGLQGYTVTFTTDNTSYSASAVVYHPDGTSESIRFKSGEPVTVSNAAYAYVYVTYNVTSIGLSPGYYNIIFFSDTTVTFSVPCILKGSLVNLWNGQTKKIEDITYDDEILCWDFDNGKYAPSKPFWIKQCQVNTYYWVNKFESGKEIKTTGTVAGHRFFNIDKGQFLYNTDCVGDMCYTKDGPDKLLETIKIEDSCEFYNIYTNYHMNMFVNGILTGFRYNSLYPIKDMKFVKDNRKLRSREEFIGIPDSWYYGMRCSEQTDSVENIQKYVIERELIKK